MCVCVCVCVCVFVCVFACVEVSNTNIIFSYFLHGCLNHHMYIHVLCSIIIFETDILYMYMYIHLYVECM